MAKCLLKNLLIDFYIVNILVVKERYFLMICLEKLLNFDDFTSLNFFISGTGFLLLLPILSHFEVKCYFSALDMASTWAGPGLFFLVLKKDRAY